MTESKLGQLIKGLVVDKNESQVFVQLEGVTYALDKPKKEYQLGDIVEGFIYENKQGKKKMVEDPPKAQVGKYGWGEVVGVQRNLGVFVDIGLPDKDIAVSLDDLHQEKALWPKQGDRLLISLKLDKHNQIWGELADPAIIATVSKAAPEEAFNQDISGVIYQLKSVGSYVLTSDNYLGFIHPSEREREPRLGEIVKGRIIAVKPDGTVNVSLRKRAYESLEDDAKMILAVLNQSPDKVIPYTDKSNPEEIRRFFGISKSQFKRALGRLMKEGLVKQEKGKTSLLSNKEGD